MELRDSALWTGGYYELSINLGEVHDDRLAAAARTLSSSAGLRPDPSAAVPDRTVPPDLLLGGLRGVVAIPGVGRTAALLHAVREDVEFTGQEAPARDWLNLCLPLGALAEVDTRVGGYPFGDTKMSPRWRGPIEDWFARIAREVFAVAPFVHAVTGFEVGGDEVDEAGGWSGLFTPGPGGKFHHRPPSAG